MTGKNNNQYWSMTEGMFNCLIDDERTEAFKKAIQGTVRKGDIVVDMGTGSGVLAMLAADCGAKKVYAVEIDKRNIKTLTATFQANNYEQTIIILEGDATTVQLPEKVDVIIGEMIATGLIEELQIQAMNNMLKFGTKDVRVLLNKIENYVDLVFNNNVYYGHKFNSIRYEYPDLKQLTSILFTESKMYSSVDFSQSTINTKVDFSTQFVIEKNGVINALRISSKTIFYDNSQLGATFAYCYPIILPIVEQQVKKGDKFVVSLSYELCGGFDTLNYSADKQS